MRSLLTLSMKGGVGKTTITIQLARALQALGYRVGLLDVDIHGSALPRALHLPHDPGYDTLTGARLRPLVFDGFELFSIGLLFDEDIANLWRGEDKESAVRQLAERVAWSPDLDWLVVDTPPSSGDEVQSLLRHLPDIYGAIILAQPNDLSLLGIRKTLDMLRETGTPICGLLANMAGYTCPHCHLLSNPFDRGAVNVAEVAQEFHLPYLGQVPFGPEAQRAPAVAQALELVLRRRPVVIPQDSGGLRRWLIGQLNQLR
jgi:ATP-binding protein involved in chromosome partitioning